MNLKIITKGGGFTAQAQSFRLALARLLIKVSPQYTKTIQDNNLLTRDPRSKERRKPGISLNI
jgi:small subunit ribosomal protein S9